MADGGEGMLDACGGANRTSTVTGPAGTLVESAWRLGEDGVAVVEAVLERLDGQRPIERGVELLAACDVQTVFTDAGKSSAPRRARPPQQVVKDDAPADRLAQLSAVSLSQAYGADPSRNDTSVCITKAVTEQLVQLN